MRTIFHRDALRRRGERAFTLIELGIVLAVIAVIVGGALMTGTNRTSYAQKHSTSEKLDRIEEALAAYYALNKRLPCAADPTVDEEAAAFGVADTVPLAPANPCPTTRVVVGGLVPDISVGMVPVTSLNLPDDFAFDGWEHRITYVVSTMAVRSNSWAFYDAFLAGSGVDLLEVDNSAGSARSSLAVYVLMSHGVDGHGAWPKTGGATRINAGSADASEMANADDPSANATLVDNVFVQSATTGTFDHDVRYKLRAQVIREAGGIVAGDACDHAALTLRVFNDEPTETTGVGLPVEGPVGCQIDDSGLAAGSPPRWNQYNTECLTRQVRLAQAIAERCVGLQ